MPDDPSLLCRSCGLCCDGSLFGRVPFADGGERAALGRRLRVVGDGRHFEQPCRALAPAGTGDAERACSVYGERPRACRSFRCRLLARHERQGGPIGPPLAAVQIARALLERVRSDRARGRVDPARVEALARRLEKDFARAEETPPSR